MEVIVENRTDPNEFYKFFDVEEIINTIMYDGITYVKAFAIRYHTTNAIECKKFPEWKYRFYLV